MELYSQNISDYQKPSKKRNFYKILTSWRIQDTKTKLDDKKQCFYIPVKFLITHKYKKSKTMACKYVYDFTKNYNHRFATKHMWKAEKIKKITYPRKGTCVCKHLFITYPAVFFFQKSNIHCVLQSHGFHQIVVLNLLHNTTLTRQKKKMKRVKANNRRSGCSGSKWAIPSGFTLFAP